MTKARTNADNASADIQGVTAGTGLTGGGTSGTVSLAVDTTTIQARVANVTDTEIGYLDGVSSAIQTQLNGKINNTLTTTTGDIIYASGANTPARLGIGSSGQMLSVSGGVPAWAAAPSAGANWSLLSSTSLSGATTTVSGISGKDKIMILINGANASANAIIGIRLNGITTYSYNFYGARWNAPSNYAASFLSAYGPGGADNLIPIGGNGSGGAAVSGYCLITGCNAAGSKVFNAAGGGASGGALQVAYSIGGYQAGASVISNISVFTDTGTFSGGTVLVYTSA